MSVGSVTDELQTLLVDALGSEADPEFFSSKGRYGIYPGHRALCAAVLAAQPRVNSWTQEWTDHQKDFDSLPRWPSNIEAIDQVYGGFFGMTALISEPGLGKTTVALTSALQAAATRKWNVIFFGAEVDDDEIQNRRAREMRTHPEALEGVDNFRFVHVGKGQGVEDFIGEMMTIDIELPILAVFDSINTIVQMHGGDYLRKLSEFCIWAAFARKISRGAFSALIVSETNKNGRSKGEQLEFWSDLAISMKGRPEETVVDFNIEKNRREQWIMLGTLTRHWKTSRFYTQEQLQRLSSGRHLRAVNEPQPMGRDDAGDDIDLF